MVKFIKAEEKDLPNIVDIYNQIIPSRLATADLEPVSVESRKSWFHSFTPTHPIWVIKNENNIIGWVALEPFYGRLAYERTAEISIYIDKNVQHENYRYHGLYFYHNLPSPKLFKFKCFEQWRHLPNVTLMDEKKYSLDILGRRF